MRKILLRTLLFLLPLGAAGLLLFAVPYSRMSAYLGKNNADCNTSWIFHRLFENSKPVDVAFLGTSHTGCAVNDLQVETESGMQVANLAYCGGGRNLDYLLIKDLLATKQPRTVIIELRNNNIVRHSDYAIMAGSHDLWNPPQMTEDYLANLYVGAKCRLDQLRERFVFGPKIELDVHQDSSGMKVMESYSHYFPHVKKKKVIITMNAGGDHSFFGAFRDTVKQEMVEGHMKHAESFLYPDIQTMERIAGLLRERGVRLWFLYLPSFGQDQRDEAMSSPYTKLGAVLLPPEKFFTTREWWIDPEHMNAAGAKELSAWLASELKK